MAGGNVTLEGLKLQIDPPKDFKKPLPWRAITVKSGSLRLLNCSISETTKQGTTALVSEGPGKVVVRNCLLVGGNAAVELVGNGQQQLAIDNTVVFSNGGIVVSNDDKTKKPAEVEIDITNSVFQVKEVVLTPKLKGKIDVTSRLNVYQADWIGSNFLASLSDKKDRSWKGSINLYDVKQWIGANGKPSPDINDSKTWIKYWGNVEIDSYKMTAPFIGAGLRQVGNFNHELSPQDWQMEFPPQAEPVFQRSRVGVNSYLAGPGQPFDQYRETIAYSDWLRGRTDLTVGK